MELGSNVCGVTEERGDVDTATPGATLATQPEKSHEGQCGDISQKSIMTKEDGDVPEEMMPAGIVL